MPPVICIVGRSGVGKTTLIERLVAEFKRRGYRVATIKHSPMGFQLEPSAKDTRRHIRAGSDTVIISSPQELALIRPQDHDASLEEILNLLGDGFDIVLAEGFKESRAPKIEVLRQASDGEPLYRTGELIAVVSETPMNKTIPHFAPDDISSVADLIERMLVKR